MDAVLLTAGLIALLVAVFLRHLQRWSITPPLLGLVGGVVIGPHVLGALELSGAEATRVLELSARLLLAVALMGIALRYPLSAARRHTHEVAVLVGLVLPAMAVVTAVLGRGVLGLSAGTALVLGAALSPTDPVLASGIVTGRLAERDVPARSRQVLSLESGANDGLALPLVLTTVAWDVGRSMPGEAAAALVQVVGGIVIGAASGVLAGRGMRWARERRELDAPVSELYTLVLAAFAMGLAEVAGANGLLAVFAAGLAHNGVVAGRDRQLELGVDEALNHFLVVPVFVLLGAALPWSGWRELGWAGVAFVAAVLALRRLPLVLALRPAIRADAAHATWLGWFGPIGVAALFYLGHAHRLGVTDPRLWAAGTLVIAASTVVHGVSSGLGRALYRRRRSRKDA